MKISPSSTLLAARRLQRLYSTDATQRKLSLLHTLDRTSLRTAREVARLHDLLCFMRAYPDNKAVLSLVEKILENFSDRKDLRRNRESLSGSGIAGTDIHYRFHWQTAKWLYDHWPVAITIDWPEFGNEPGLDELWPLILPSPAMETLEHVSLSSREWIAALKQPSETDAAFVVRLFARWAVGDTVREKTYDDLDVPLTLTPVRDSPSRTRAQYKPKNIAYGPPETYNPSSPHRPRFGHKPLKVSSVRVDYGRRLIDLARIQMVTRSRDLYAFMHANPFDVRIVTFEAGLQFVCYGLQVHARALLETLYVFLILRNGLPVGYTQATALFRSAEINFNIFDTFRGAETSLTFHTTLTMVHHLLGCDTFIINTQQLGEDNAEALKTGAFWFYYKHGFRSRDRDVRAVIRSELARKKREPNHRSDLRTLRRLAGDDLYLFAGNPRSDLVNNIPSANIGLAAARILESYACPSDPTGARHCISAASRLLGCRIDSRLPAPLRETWARWSPVVLSLAGVSRWSRSSKRALVDVINAKGSRRESEFVARFDQHRTLRKALIKLGNP